MGICPFSPKNVSRKSSSWNFLRGIQKKDFNASRYISFETLILDFGEDELPFQFSPIKFECHHQAGR